MEDRELQEAIKVLQKCLREDKSPGSYYDSWKANIAMAFVDEIERMDEDMGRKFMYSNRIEIANQSAINFLELLIKE